MTIKNKMPQRLALCLAATGLLAAPATMGANIATFEFTGGSLVPTLGAFATTNGITVSDLSTGTLGDLFDNGGSGDHLRISGDDAAGSTGDAFTNGAYLSFTVTIPGTVTIDLTGLSADVHVVNAWNWSSSRIFSSVQGFDDVTGDTIGKFGLDAYGDLGPVNQFSDLADPSSNTAVGGNVSAGDFDNLTSTAITFYVPWNDNSTSATRYTDLDNLTIFGVASAVPEPSSAALLGLGGIALILRRRK